MKKLLGIVVLGLLLSANSFVADWKVKNKWKISCGIVDKESLVVNGKPKTKFVKKKEFKLESVVFKLDKGDIGSCPTDKKPVIDKYDYSGRQEITHRLPIGQTIFETTATTCAGLSAGLFVSIPGLQNFIVLMMILLILALLASSILLPSIIVLQKEFTSQLMGNGSWLDYDDSGSLASSSAIDALVTGLDGMDRIG